MSVSESYRSLCSRGTLQNKKEGCFFDLVGKLRTKINLDEFSASSSDIERVRYCADALWDSIGVELIFRGKDADEGLRHRMDGNVAFEKGDLPLALLCYSKSVIRSPPGEGLAAVLANRSALLLKMKEWELAIEDSKLAISYNYPEDKRHKLYERMTEAYIHLKNFAKAKVTLGLAEHFASKQSDFTLKRKLEKFRVDITKGTLDAAEKVQGQSQAHDPRSSAFPVASHKFTVTSSATSGRGAIAAEDIQVGEEILAEAPFASCLLPERNGTHCHHCFQRLRAPIPCETCAYVAFCSSPCRQQATNYHQFECKVLLLLVGSGMSVLPLLAFRILTQQHLQNVLTEWESLQIESNQVLLNGSIYNGNSYENVYNLIGHENERDPDDFFQRTVMALFLLKCLRLVGYFQINIFSIPKPSEEELRIGSLILRNLQVLQFNAYEIVESELPLNTSCSQLRLIPIGLGIYPTAAFLNHSCAPNVGRYFNGAQLHVTATQTILQGQSIADNYGPIFTKVIKENRRRVLRGRYWFECNCIACMGNWVRLEEMLGPIEDAQPSNHLHEHFHSAMKLMDKGQAEAAKKLLVEYIKNCYKLLPTQGLLHQHPIKNVLLAEEALRLVLTAIRSQ